MCMGFTCIRTYAISKVLIYGREMSNGKDRHTIAIYKSKEIVSNVPHLISSLCAAFIRWGGIIKYAVEGDRCYYSYLCSTKRHGNSMQVKAH